MEFRAGQSLKTFLHLNAISYAFSSAGTINFSSAGTFLHLNAISYVFSSAGTFNFSSAGTYNFNSAGTIILVLLGPFCT